MYAPCLIRSYDEIIIPQSVKNAGKASYVERNQEMIDASDFCIFYYKPFYLPPKRKYAKRDISEYQPKSGTALAFNYANSRKISGRMLVIINICEGLGERF